MRALLKIKKNRNITLPLWVIRRFGVRPGDFVRLEETKRGIVLKPVKLVNPSPGLFLDFRVAGGGTGGPGGYPQGAPQEVQENEGFDQGFAFVKAVFRQP